MTGAVNISAAACETRAAMLDRQTARMIFALRAALDAAERERDEAREDYQRLVDRDNADYARGVRNAAGVVMGWPLSRKAQIYSERDVVGRDLKMHAAILALLPENKETNDA